MPLRPRIRPLVIGDVSKRYLCSARASHRTLTLSKQGIYLIESRGKRNSFKLIPWEQVLASLKI